MKKIFAIALLVPVLVFSQQRKTIDSINNIPFDTKVNRAATIDTLYLQNAKNAARIKYALGEADSYSNLGLAYYYQGKYGPNVAYRLKAIRMYEAIGATEKLAYEYGELGYSMKRRNMAKASEYMQKAKSIAESGNLKKPLLSIYNNYGVLKEMRNQLDSALYFYEKGLKLKQSVNDTLGIPYSLDNIAGIYVMTKKYDDAQRIYDEVINIYSGQKQNVGLAENLALVGDLDAAKKDFAKAVDYYKKSLEKAVESKYTYLIASDYQSISKMYEQLGNTAEAFRNYKLYSQYNDSLVNKETNSKIAELEVRFETGKKEKQLLEKKAEVKQRKIQIVAISVIALFLAIVGLLMYRQQKLKNRQQAQQHELKTAIGQIETQNKLQQQRLEISRDLHDNIGAQLTFIISSMDNIRYAFDLKNSKLDLKLQSIGNFTKDTIVELRDTIWAMNNSRISFEDLRARILNFIEKAKEAVGNIDFRFTIDEALSDIELTSVQGMNLYRSIQEAVNNALKYADASEIAIDIRREANEISISISDNGSGFDESKILRGNGIGNMQNRVAAIGGTYNMTSTPGFGTKINIVIPTPTL